MTTEKRHNQSDQSPRPKQQEGQQSSEHAKPNPEGSGAPVKPGSKVGLRKSRHLHEDASITDRTLRKGKIVDPDDDDAEEIDRLKE